MIASRRNFLAGFGSLLAAPAVVRADSLMHVRSIVKPYATVWGVGWDLGVIEHAVWTPDDALRFARFGIGRDGINKFREVTEVVYAKPPSPVLCSDHWVKRVSPTQAFFEEERRKLAKCGEDGEPTQLIIASSQDRWFGIRKGYEEAGVWV